MIKKIKCIPTIGQYNDMSIYTKLVMNYVKNKIDTIRVNCTRFSLDEYEEILNIYKRLFGDQGISVKILLDIPSPGEKIRIKLPSNQREMEIYENEEYKVISAGQTYKNMDANRVIILDDKEFMKYVSVGEKIVAADGEIQFKVVNYCKDSICVIALNSGVLRFGKALYKKNCYFRRGNTKEQIKSYYKFIKNVHPYGIILSFLEDANDVEIYQKVFPDVQIIPKIETPMGVHNIDRITDVASVIMFGRGDLGNICTEKLGYFQDKIFRQCQNKNIKLIVATGILNSLCNNQPIIERAEILDGYYLAKNGVDFVVASNPISKNEKQMDRFVDFWNTLYVETI